MSDLELVLTLISTDRKGTPEIYISASKELYELRAELEKVKKARDDSDRAIVRLLAERDEHQAGEKKMREMVCLEELRVKQLTDERDAALVDSDNWQKMYEKAISERDASQEVRNHLYEEVAALKADEETYYAADDKVAELENKVYFLEKALRSWVDLYDHDVLIVAKNGNEHNGIDEGEYYGGLALEETIKLTKDAMKGGDA